MKKEERLVALCLFILFIAIVLFFNDNEKVGRRIKDADGTATIQTSNQAKTATALALIGVAQAATATTVSGTVIAQNENATATATTATAIAIQQGEYIVVEQSNSTPAKVGDAFHIKFRLRNIGSNAWSNQNGYQLQCIVNDNISTIPCESSTVSWCHAIVKPNDECDFSITMQAPTQPGRYQALWQLQHNNQSVAPQGSPYMFVVVTVT